MENIAYKINESIKETFIYKEYLRLKALVDENAHLHSLQEKKDLLKQEICKSKNKVLLEEYYLVEDEYKNNELVKEYLSLKEEVYDLLKNIVNILSFN